MPVSCLWPCPACMRRFGCGSYVLRQAAPQHLHVGSRHVPAMYLHAAGICTGKGTNTVHQRSMLTMFAYAECSQVSRGCVHGVRHGRPELPGVGRAAADAVATEHRAVAGSGCISWACIGRLSSTKVHTAQGTQGRSRGCVYKSDRSATGGATSMLTAPRLAALCLGVNSHDAWLAKVQMCAYQ